jgi:hypothetical protein
MARLEAMAAQMLARQNGAQGDPQAWLTDLQRKEYISGQDAAQLFHGVHQGFTGVAKALEQRDAIIKTMYNVVMQQQRALQGIHGQTQQTTLDRKLDEFVRQVGRDPQDYKEFARELYHAYEGDDLDYEFPQILQRRLEQLERLSEKARSQKVAAARKSPFPIPGKGGAGAAPKGPGLTGRESSKQTADSLWEMLAQSEET